jgi:predicted nucleic acid-binding protein
LCCRQEAFSSISRNLLREFPKIVVWWGSRVEVENGFYRLVRKGEMKEKELSLAVQNLSLISARWREILPMEQVRELALEAVRLHALTTADSFQLAAALVWCGGKPRRRPLVCYDRNLKEAAQEWGFEVHSYP